LGGGIAGVFKDLTATEVKGLWQRGAGMEGGEKVLRTGAGLKRNKRKDVEWKRSLNRHSPKSKLVRERGKRG